MTEITADLREALTDALVTSRLWRARALDAERELSLRDEELRAAGARVRELEQAVSELLGVVA